MDERKLSVLTVTSEAAPFARTGGLGDVAGALPGALRALGARMSVIMPFYRSIRETGIEAPTVIERLPVPLGADILYAGLRKHETEDGVTVYFLDREDLYDRPNLYGGAGGDYYDNPERFSFFCRGALTAASVLDLRPDVIHCHDWQAALIAPLLAGPHRSTTGLQRSRTVLTIHNIGYQGIYPAGRFPVTGLSAGEFFHMEGLEYWGNMNLLKGGIVYSDAATTVSPSYALEIQTPEFGMGLEDVLRARSASMRGILNGVDYRIWNPAADPSIAARYSPADMSGKAECKRDLLARSGLDASSADRPVLGIVSRLDRQKGLDLVVEAVDSLINLGTSLVILGAGDPAIQLRLEASAARLPGRVAVFVGFDDEMAHRIIAGSDMLLVPSRYEPCGLTQIYALKYGTVPVVRSVGGLKDTVVDAGEAGGRGTGFKFRNFNLPSFMDAVKRAVKTFEKPEAMRRVVTAAMNADFSWNRSAGEYLALYRDIAD